LWQIADEERPAIRNQCGAIERKNVTMIDFEHLDNPVWKSLATDHRLMAQSLGLANRYASDVAPFGGLQTPTSTAFADLASLVASEENVGLCTSEILHVPDEWQIIRAQPVLQMISTRLTHTSLPTSPEELHQADVAEMLSLTSATEPGPFLPATIRMGRYFGFRATDGTLIAMAGERLKPKGFTEISAVCTDPKYRGRGYAKALVSFLAARILSEGRVPFLHVKTENDARLLYERIGFRVRCEMHLTVIARR
jgi:ribosomal protein S18 acetylase RimI-like enzyme